MRIHSFATPSELGSACGSHAARILAERLASPGRARVMLAAAPSQRFTLHTLREADIDFSRVEFFHMDEYVGLPASARQGFGNWLERELISHISSAAFHRIGSTGDAQAESDRYSALIGSGDFDLTLCGLGVNGHLAFNDPPADLEDPSAVRRVRLDEASRRQQLDEGHFSSLEEVPTEAITVTIPQLLRARRVLVSVPGRAKRQAVRETLVEPISGDHPGTALRTHPEVDLYLDADSDPR